MMDFRKKSKGINDQGQNLVEFALILPLLVLIFLGALDLGRIFFATINLTNAAREAARYVTRDPLDALTGFDEARKVAVQEAQLGGISTDTLIVDVGCDKIDSEGCVEGALTEVTVSYTFDMILGWLLPSVNLSRSAVMVVP